MDCGAPLVGFSPKTTVLAVCCGGGVGAPPEGISPAIDVTESAQAIATVMSKRFMDLFSLRLGMQDFLHKTE